MRNRIIKKAKRKRAGFKNLLVIGITGSYGKTSTKEFLYRMLADKFGESKVLKTKEHQNSEVGISQCILNDLEEEHKIFICEMGAYNRGGIRLLCDIAKPKIGILTGINEQHMATFGSQENIVRGKYELIESLPLDGTAILNGNNSHCLEIYDEIAIDKRIYGLQSSISRVPPDIWAYNIKAERDYISFTVVSKNGEQCDFKVNLLGYHNVLDILGAVLAARELGIILEETAKACEKIKQEDGAMVLKKGINGLNIIDSTYSANPDGVISDLDYLKIYEGKKILIMPCLIELGKSSAEVHKRIGQKIGEVCDLAIITTKDKFKEMKNEAIKGKMKKEDFLFIEDPKKIFKKINTLARPGDVVILESRVPKQLIEFLTK